MLTIAQIPNDTIADVSTQTIDTQNETLPTDAEISRRVLRIRAGWTLEERIQRRHDAEQRFCDLLDALVNSAA